MTVIISPTEALDERTRAEIVGVCVAAHAEPDFDRLFRYIGTGGRHFIAYAGAAIVSHAVVTTRWLLVAGDRRLRTAYVDAVATLPEFQGQGHGTRVMRQLASGIDDYEIACLETERPTFYTRLGWERWRGPLAVAEASRITPTPEQRGILVLRTGHTPKVDLDTTLTIESLNGRSW